MKNVKGDSLLSKSLKEQKIFMQDERFIQINEKVACSVSKIMNWIFVILLFVTGLAMKNMTALFLISIIIIIKFILTIIYSYYYNKISWLVV